MIENYKNYPSFDFIDDPIKVRMIGETFCDGNFKINRECSDLTAIEFIIDGEGVLNIENQRFHPTRDDVFLLTEGTKHFYQSDAEQPWHKYWIIFGGDLAKSFIDAYIPENTYYFKGCSGIKQYFEEIVRISKQDYPYNVMMNKISTRLLQIFMYLRDYTVDNTEDLADRIKHILDESIESEFNLDSLCRSINYSKNYVISIFRDKYGVTPYKYFTQRKMDVAKVYLAHTNKSIGTIAKTLHFADQQYFSTVFKSSEGMSPLEYRRKTRP